MTGDPRELPATAPRSTIRYDVLTGEWVTLAGHRRDRTHLPPDDQCPLCPSRNGRWTEIPEPDYDVVVFENRFPSYAYPTDEDGQPADPLFAERAGTGRCEVVCFTADHDSSFAALGPARVGTVIEAWIDRTRELSALPGVEQVFCFENRGEQIGVTLRHPHGQIYGYPFVPPATGRTLERARAYRTSTGRDLFGDVLAAELRHGERVVARGRYWTAFVPFAARWPLELHLYPNRQVPDLAGLTDDERAELSWMYPDALRRIEAVYDEPPTYVAAWHQAPVRRDRDLSYLRLRIHSIRRAPGRLKYLAGSESAMGAFVNDVAPETAARLLRAAGS